MLNSKYDEILSGKTGKTLFVLLSVFAVTAAGLSLFSAPAMDECWRVLLVQQQKNAVYSFFPQYFYWIRHLNIFQMRLVVAGIGILSWFFLGFCTFVFIRQKTNVSKHSWLLFCILPVVMWIITSAESFGAWSCNPDYINLSIWCTNICIGLAILILSGAFSERNKILFSFLIGLAGSQFLFFALPAAGMIALWGIFLLFSKRSKEFWGTVAGGCCGILFFFVLICPPADFVRYIEKVAANSSNISDDHSVISKVLPWIGTTVYDIFKRVFFLSVPVACFSCFKKNKVMTTIAVLSIIFFLLRLLKLIPIPGISTSLAVPFPMLMQYEIAMGILLVFLMKLPPNQWGTNEEILVFAIMLLAVPVLARIGSNVFFNLTCNCFTPYPALLICSMLYLTRDRVFKRIWQISFLIALFSSMLHIFVAPEAVLQKDRRSLQDYGEPMLYVTSAKFTELRTIEDAVQKTPYIITGGAGWRFHYLLKKECLHIQDYHYSQKMDLAKLITAKKIPLENFSVIIYPGSWFTLKTLDELAAAQSARKVLIAQSGSTSVWNIRKP